MQILGIYSEDYPWDVRVEKILGGLAGMGHGVDLVCRNTKGSSPEERLGGITCHRIPSFKTAGALDKVLSVPAPFNPMWRRKVDRLCRRRPAAIIVRDVPLSPLALDMGKRFSIPVIVDMAENHPAMWRNVLVSDRYKIPSFIMKNPAVAEACERRVVQEADGIFVVVKEMRDRLIGMGAPTERVHVVSNTPRLHHWSDLAVEPGSLVQGQGQAQRLNVIFVGLVSRTRGLETMLRALTRFPTNSERPLFHIVGDGAYLSKVRQLAAELDLGHDIVFHGWVDHGNLPKLISGCDVGIIPHLVDDHTNTTIPNKIFDYMSQRLPVLVSDARPMQRIVTETGGGLVFKGEDEKDLSRCLTVLGDPDLRKQMGSRGRTAVEQEYNWERSFEKVVEVLETINRD